MRRATAGACIAAAMGAAALIATASPTSAATTQSVVVTHLTGYISTSTADSVDDAIHTATVDSAAAVVLVIDSTGSSESVMYRVIHSVLTSPVTVVAYVPANARADSGALLIAESADVFAAAPSASIGAAHPIALTGEGDAVDSALGTTSVLTSAPTLATTLAGEHLRSGDWVSQALRNGTTGAVSTALVGHAVDVQAADLPTLLQELDNRTPVGRDRLNTSGATTISDDASGFAAIRIAIAQPDVAYLLLAILIGLLAIFMAHPGGIPAGIGSVLAGLVAILAFAQLSINPLGLALLGLAVALFVVDIAAPTHGLLTALGAVALALGGSMLINTTTVDGGVNPALVIITVLTITAAYGVLVPKLVAARRKPYADIATQLVGRVATVRERLHPDGFVSLEGALWKATSTQSPMQPGTKVRVLAVNGLRLTVEPDTSVAAETTPADVPSIYTDIQAGELPVPQEIGAAQELTAGAFASATPSANASDASKASQQE